MTYKKDSMRPNEIVILKLPSWHHFWQLQTSDLNPHHQTNDSIF